MDVTGYLTARQCAERADPPIKVQTWWAYVQRGLAPAYDVKRDGRALWRPATHDRWQATRTARQQARTAMQSATRWANGPTITPPKEQP